MSKTGDGPESDQPLSEPSEIATGDRSHVNHTRRRILVAGGFGGAAWLVLRAAGGDRPEGITASPPAPGSSTTTVTVREPPPPPEMEGAGPEPEAGHVFDMVIAGGRVIDPETGFDSVANVGIDGGRITGLSLGPLEGRASIDASGMVVSPGFIDLLSYEPNSYGIWFKVADGVTTNLGMHGINSISAAQFFAAYTGVSPCHFGGAFDNPYVRYQQLGLGLYDAAQPFQIDQMEDAARVGFDEGWLGLDFEPEYTPGIETVEMIELGRVAAERGLPIFFHVRYSDPDRNAEAINEVIQVAHETGAAVHIDHITSTGGTFTMEQTLATLETARGNGVDITADMYPYTSWATYLQATRFGPDPQTGEPAVERFGIDYGDLQIVGTPERLTQERFDELRATGQNPLVAALGSIPEADLEAALRAEFVMIGSDAILEPGDNNHPRSTGCFARTLGRYVREKRIMTLQQALAKMTLLPAQRLQAAVPAMARKGRLQRGADADVTIFDPDTISDRSTIESPAQESVGVAYVLVLGQVVKDPAGLKKDVIPGQPIRPEAT